MAVVGAVAVAVAGTQASQMEVIPARVCLLKMERVFAHHPVQVPARAYLLKMERDDRFQNEYSCDLTKGGYAEFD